MRSLTLCALLLAPMGVAVEIPTDSLEVPPPLDGDGSSKTTSFTFGAGQGTYGRTIHATRVISLGYSDCTGTESSQVLEGNFKFENEYKDYGGQLDHQVSDAVHIGLRGGHVRESASYLGSTLGSYDPALEDSLFADVAPDSSYSYNYFNPYFSVEKENWGFGLGVVFANNQLWHDTEEYGDHDDDSVNPTGHLRLGQLDKLYLNASLWESVPIYSGGGMVTVGAGLRPVSWLELWGGASTGGPYTQGNYLVRANLDMGRHFTLGSSFRFPKDTDSDFDEDVSEIGGSISLTYKLHRD